MSGATTINSASALTVKSWSANLFLETTKSSYFGTKFVGNSSNNCIQRLTDLETDAGDTINFSLKLKMIGEPIYGDNIAQGKEKALRFAEDQVKIDQMFQPVSAGGVMSRQRTKHNLRKEAMDTLSTYWAAVFDETMFIYLSGARGINQGFNFGLNWAGHAENPIEAPDSAHLLYGGTATSKATIASSHTMSKQLIDRASTKAKMMGEVDPTVAKMVPLNVGAEKHFVCVMSPFQAHDLKIDATPTGWFEIQKAATTKLGESSPIFTGSLGMIDNVVLHSHESAIRFSDYGSGANLPAGRALFLGAQAGVIAYGNGSMNKMNPSRVNWVEETADYERQLNVGSGFVFGFKKTRFNSKDFGVFSIDTYAKDPSA